MPNRLPIGSVFLLCFLAWGPPARGAPPVELPAPHGGRLEKAKVRGPHNQPPGKSGPLFFELLQRPDRLTLYPHVQESSGKLRAVAPKAAFPEIELTLIGKNRQQPVKLLTTTTDRAIEAKISSLSKEALGLEAGDPLELKISVIHHRVPKTARFRIEKESLLGARPARPAQPAPGAKPAAPADKKGSYVAGVEARIAEWERRVRELRRRGETALDSRKNDLRAAGRYLEEKLETLKAELKRLGDSRHLTWIATKRRIEAELAAMRSRHESVAAE